MCEGLELPWDYILLMILIYMAYDVFYINKIPPLTLPATTYTFFNPMTRPQSRLFLNVRAAVSRTPMVPALLLPGPELPGPEEGDTPHSGVLRWLLAFP